MKTITPLNRENLKKINTRIGIPSFDEDTCKTGIVHIGVGGFHRAHQAYYMQKLLETGESTAYGICGVGLRKNDRKIADVLKKQDGLYTLIVKHPNGTVESQVIGTILDFMLGVDQADAVIEKMASPDTKIVSLTITEGGYNFNPTTGEFDFENKAIKHDLKYPEQPKTVYGFLTAALKKRYQNNLPAFTIMSCDNIEHNGEVAKKMLLAFTNKQNPELAAWIKKEVCFPNSMVDRITPVTTAADITYLTENYNLKDEWPVTCEPFIQWVIEDKFSNGRPALEKVGVQFVPDVKPYEKMKLRLLNAGHSVLGILGAIHGHKTINDCMADPIFAEYLRAFMDTEASTILDPLEGINLTKYKDSLEERFANPNIKDSVSRICSESAAKLPKFLIPTIKENLANGGSIAFATLVIAGWCYYSDKQKDFSGKPLDISDAASTQLHQAAKETKDNPLAFIQQEAIFGSLAKDHKFAQLYTTMLQKIYKEEDIVKQMQNLM